jgi:hypothetical protein
MRELSDRCLEIFALVSLNESFVSGVGGGADWLVEHLREGHGARVVWPKFTLEDAIGSHACSRVVSNLLTGSRCKLRPNTEGTCLPGQTQSRRLLVVLLSLILILPKECTFKTQLFVYGRYHAGTTTMLLGSSK